MDRGGRFYPAASQLLCSWKLPRCPLNPGKVAKPSHRVGGVQQVAQAYLRRVDLCRGKTLSAPDALLWQEAPHLSYYSCPPPAVSPSEFKYLCLLLVNVSTKMSVEAEEQTG